MPRKNKLLQIVKEGREEKERGKEVVKDEGRREKRYISSTEEFQIIQIPSPLQELSLPSLSHPPRLEYILCLVTCFHQVVK